MRYELKIQNVRVEEAPAKFQNFQDNACDCGVKVVESAEALSSVTLMVR